MLSALPGGDRTPKMVKKWLAGSTYRRPAPPRGIPRAPLGTWPALSRIPCYLCACAPGLSWPVLAAWPGGGDWRDGFDPYHPCTLDWQESHPISTPVPDPGSARDIRDLDGELKLDGPGDGSGVPTLITWSRCNPGLDTWSLRYLVARSLESVSVSGYLVSRPPLKVGRSSSLQVWCVGVGSVHLHCGHGRQPCLL